MIVKQDTNDGRTDYTVLSAVQATKTFKFDNPVGDSTDDYTGFMLAGRSFYLLGGSNQAEYTIATATWDGTNTYVAVVEDLAHATAGGTAHWYETIDLTFGARVHPVFTLPGKRVVDRLGTPHRIMPTLAASKKRYVASLTLSFEQSEFLKETTHSRRVQDFLQDWCLDTDSLLFVYAYKTSESNEGTTFTEMKVYQAYLEDVPAYVFDTEAIMDGEYENRVELPMLVVNDGTYTVMGQEISGVTWRRT